MRLEDQEVLMLHPLWQHFVWVRFLRSSNGAVLFNIAKWPMYSVERWIEFLLYLESVSIVQFRVGRDSVHPTASIVRDHFTVPTAISARLYVGFTSYGGRFWENRSGLDWTNWWEIEVCERESNVVRAHFASMDAAMDFNKQRVWSSSSVRQDVIGDYSPVYWKVLSGVCRLTFLLDDDEVNQFELTQVIRSQAPSLKMT